MPVASVDDVVGATPEPTKYLEQIGTNDLYAYNPILARRSDMRPTDRTPDSPASEVDAVQAAAASVAAQAAKAAQKKSAPKTDEKVAE